MNPPETTGAKVPATLGEAIRNMKPVDWVAAIAFWGGAATWAFAKKKSTKKTGRNVLLSSVAFSAGKALIKHL